MKLFVILIINNVMQQTAYGGTQPLRQIVLFVFTPDGNGMRYEKVVNGTTTSYYYDGTQLLMESKNGQRTWYIYGVTGIEGMIREENYGESEYYFDKNTLGDIVAIRDEDGNIIATYEYDAWGYCTVMDEYGYANTSSSFIGNVNPIRYRGYYYDTETGFYYLQTRYYDPTICRFINADNYELVATLSSVPGQLNMYAYCGNNPIMYTDETGCFWDYVFDAVFLIWDIIDVCKNPGDWTNWAALGIDAVFAVIPFVASGAGKVVKVANVADDIMDIKKVTIIGESMNRVQDTAMLIGHVDDLYGGYKAYNKLSSLGKGGKVLAEIGGKASNIAWLYGKVRAGYTIVDIGIDIGRVGRSSSYMAERVFLGIWQSRNIWKSFYHLGG